LAARSADHAFCPLFTSFFGALARTFLSWRRRFDIGNNFGNLSFSFFRKRKVQNDFCFCGTIEMQPIKIFFVLKKPSWTVRIYLYWLHQGGFLSALVLSI